jgi:ATP/maltotriose-dependent transcriptional regulator MalT/DNA-binding SARP family transcriptional activator
MPVPERPSVDTQRRGFVSFAPPVAPMAAEGPALRQRVPVGPGRSAIEAPALVSRGQHAEVSGYPVQPSKVQRPPLRDETLARDRLLDWLHAKIHHRVVYVIAEAGYGKTTLLADFSRRTRHRTLWYRLDADDGNWLAFLSHLVAAGREQDSGFAPATAGLLRELVTGGPSLDAVLETFIRELQSLAESGAVVILDDYHLVEDAADVKLIMRELLARAPERVTFAIASRRTPSLPVARLRGQGEVAELGTDDLRFSETETDRLFRETYGRPLDPDVLNDLSRRTEGWAASLQLVQAAIRGRTSGEIRSFVRSLSGAEGELYDYLAEEVIGGLPNELQSFVMRASLLEVVDPSYAVVACAGGLPTAQRLIDEAARAGLLTRRDSRAKGQFHPLVSQFLRERLTREVGPEGVREMHRAVAREASGSDWRTAVRHFVAADDEAAAVAVVGRHLATIASQGSYEEAARLVRESGDAALEPALQIVLSRVDLQRGRLDQAETRAAQALQLAEEGQSAREIALATLMTVAVDAGDGEVARKLARDLTAATEDTVLLAIASATLMLTDVSVDGELAPFRLSLEAMADQQLNAGQLHYYGVTMLNIAECLRAEGRFEEALAASAASADALEQSSAGMELAMAHGVHAWAMAHLYGLSFAAKDRELALRVESAVWRLQVTAELADLEGFYGDPSRAATLLEDNHEQALPPAVARPLAATRARSLMRLGRLTEANQLLQELRNGGATTLPGFESSVLATSSLLATMAEDPDAVTVAEESAKWCRRQGAGLWLGLAEVARVFAEPPDMGRSRLRGLLDSPVYLSMAAELVTRRLDWFSETDLLLLVDEVRSRPTRWRAALRDAVGSGSPDVAVRAARILDEVGEQPDVSLLRSAARKYRRLPEAAALGRGLSRRLAGRLVVEDLGRVRVHVGDRQVPSSAIRRKVLALLCFLLIQRDLSATRDQVLDALWPDQDPGQALNSLNQTLYFLRRVIEPAYDDDLTPGYVHHSAEVIWLDRDLVTSRSTVCRDRIRTLPAEPTPEDVNVLLDNYTGRFALDFEYEEWAAEYRDWLHAAFLEVIERSIKLDSKTGHYDRAVRSAQRALEVDPEAEQLELSLLRLYRLTGAHAAAAEQYAHYSAMLRTTLGVEAPPLESL